MSDTKTMLTDLASWLRELEDLERSLPGPRSPRAGTGSTTGKTLVPAGVIVDTDEHGTPVSHHAITRWALDRAADAATTRGDTPPRDGRTALTYLASIADWAEKIWQPEWADLARTTQKIHDICATRTGHASAPIDTRCWCGQTCYRKPEERTGLSDDITCAAGHHYPSLEALRDTRRAVMRLIVEPGTRWVSGAEAVGAQGLWPGVSRQLLREWALDGRVDRDEHGAYDLAQVNECVRVYLERRAREG